MADGRVAEREQLYVTNFRDLAIRLLDAAGPLELHQATQETFRTLREHLAARFGGYGYEVILKRAIRLTESSFRPASTLGTQTDGTLTGVDLLLGEFPLEAVRDRVVDVLANALGLVATFVGDDLTIKIVQSRWPNIVPELRDGTGLEWWFGLEAQLPIPES
jgi:hypothetical protein